MIPVMCDISRMNIQTCYQTINDLTIQYLAAGDESSPPVILMHGGGIDSAWVSWRYLIPVLAQTHRVYAPNLPGYGESTRPTEPYTTEFLVNTLSALMDAWRLPKTALVGLSMGGATCLGYTLQNPENVSQLVLVDSYGMQSKAPWQPFSSFALALPDTVSNLAWAILRRSRLILRLGLSAIYRNPLKLTRDTLDDAQQYIHVDVFYEWLRTEVTLQGCRTNYTDQLHTLHVPTLLVHGQHDPSIPRKWAAQAVDYLTNGELVVIPNCGHWANREQPEVFNRIVMDYLNRSS